jgi:DNA-binding transcriptional regulator YiaG
MRHIAMSKPSKTTTETTMGQDPEDVKTPQSVKDWEAGKPISVETTIEKIERMRKQLKELEEQNEDEQREKLVGLPVSLGFGGGIGGMVKLIQALMPFTKGRLILTDSAESGSAILPSSIGVAKTPGTRAKVTPELKEKAINLLRDTGMTSAQVAAEVGVSSATVALWKKGAGLTKARK